MEANETPCPQDKRDKRRRVSSAPLLDEEEELLASSLAPCVPVTAHHFDPQEDEDDNTGSQPEDGIEEEEEEQPGRWDEGGIDMAGGQTDNDDVEEQVPDNEDVFGSSNGVCSSQYTLSCTNFEISFRLRCSKQKFLNAPTIGVKPPKAAMVEVLANLTK